MLKSKTTIKNRVLFEQKLVDWMSSPEDPHNVMKPIDNLTYNLFVKKFNEKYGSILNENQKTLISNYVSINPENAVEFKLYVVDEISRLKEAIIQMQEKQTLQEDKELLSKSGEVLSILEGFSEQKINDNMIGEILKIQSLVTEV